jgi:hypothetical protein
MRKKVGSEYSFLEIIVTGIMNVAVINNNIFMKVKILNALSKSIKAKGMKKNNEPGE